jgi:hypothetical protein
MGGKEEQIRPPGEESIPETPFGKAMREAVERRKREEDPTYEGGNPKDVADVKKDLGQLGIIEKNYSPEEEKKLEAEFNENMQETIKMVLSSKNGIKENQK